MFSKNLFHDLVKSLKNIEILLYLKKIKNIIYKLILFFLNKIINSTNPFINKIFFIRK